MQKTCAIKVLGQQDFETHGLAQNMRGLEAACQAGNGSAFQGY